MDTGAGAAPPGTASPAGEAGTCGTGAGEDEGSTGACGRIRPADELCHGLLFESTVHGVVYQDAGGLIIAANPSAERILGVSREQLQGRTSADPRWRAVREDGTGFPAEEHPASVALRTGRPVHDVVFGIFNPAAGEVRWLTVSATPEFRPGENAPCRVFTTFADVTELKRAEQDLRESEERMRIAQEATGLGVYDWDIAAGTLEWDERTRTLFGVGADEPVTFETFVSGVHPDDRARVTADIRRALATPGSRSVELEFRGLSRSDGRVRRLRSTGHLTFAGDTAMRLVGAIEDITERARTEDESRDREDHQTFILQLNDRLRTMSDEDDMLRAAAEALQRKLDLDVASWEVPGDADDAGAEVFFDGDGPPPAALPQDGRAAAGAVVPVLRGRRAAARLYVRHRAPHRWSDRERRLLRHAAERTWLAVERVRADQAVRHEAARLQAVIDAMPVGIAFLDESGRLTGTNDKAAELWRGIAPVDSVEGFTEYQGFWPGTGRRVETHEWPAALALRDGAVTKDVVVDIERFDGSRGTIVLSGAPIVLEGHTTGAVVGMQDITDLRRAEQALRLLTDEVRVLHEASVLGADMSLDDLTRTVAVQARALLASDGCSVYRVGEDGNLRRQLLVGSPSAKSGPGVRRLVEEAVAGASRSRRPEEGRGGGEAPRQGSEPHEGTCLAVPLALRDDVLGAIALHFRQPHRFDEHYERVARAFADQAALAIENARLRARVAESAAERERSRLARDLHDSVTQSLFAASLKAEALSRVGDVSAKTRETIEQVRRLTRGALAQMRTMLLEMREEPLSDVPLAELLRHLAEAAASHSRVDVGLTVRGAAALQPGLHEALYRIAQESLNNVVRHARATRAWVVLEHTGGHVRLVVGDDGLGFDPTVARASHLGLRTMQERAHSAGADFSLSTRVGSGTVITVEWPGGDHRD